MRSNVLASGYLPELGPLYPGKVRDNHVIGDKRVLVASDRISAFDRVLNVLIPEKGAILNAIAMWWFKQTEKVVRNHVIDWPDPNVLIARQAKVFPVEMVVRGYITGSAWEDLQTGRFEQKYGFTLTTRDVVGGKLIKNCKLRKPIVTPTTKAQTGHDQPLTPQGVRTLIGKTYSRLSEKALALYERGAKLADERGLILVDTKYEFGELDGEILLIDEAHTPDSSRYWYKEEYRAGRAMEELSKQFVRDIVKKKDLTLRDVTETSRRYIELYEQLTAEKWQRLSEGPPVQQRVVNNLIREGYIRGGFVQIIAGSEKDDWHVEALEEELKARKIPHAHRVSSAHKKTRELLGLIEMLNQSIEPVVAITVAGGSDALSGVVAHHARFPVIACPPYKDELSYFVNVHSTLQMPSQVPVLFVKRPGNAALAAERILASQNPLFAQSARQKAI